MHRRKNIRLAEFDYSQNGGYFITICTHEKKKILSRILPGTEQNGASVALTELGLITKDVLEELPAHYGFRLDRSVIMPNHIHLLLFKESGENDKTVGMLIGAIKSLIMNRWCKQCDARAIQAGKVWQRNYYDHVLRNEADYIEKRKYIEENPDKWHTDELYII